MLTGAASESNEREKSMSDNTGALLEKLQEERQNRAAEARAAAAKQVLEAAQTLVAGAPTSSPASDALKKCYERPDAGGKEGAIHDTDNRIRDAK